ncbi:uncharacterized protein Z520_02109 [Fonsecaea multimorphosa CBS 102226]|uniref:tRNA(His) guanylyltransferase n=1 Tax=Fonsecaea multimorphosa CBS 102226 TaxID=1442371 RepID=A0A0D2HJB7_9EURO|nr:uncharacterized protein Z520_02109 [Fonsecaea multimorphosa CBS 102226]KIY01971.1 hypothetical protein Z520_02109 [Fonsecaea multimorphosa CBS 102226]OAL29652.1 hypothetical protein AYO22_02066 [Fonsecaea multimorphosa]
MNCAATHVVTSIPDVVVAYGCSDEFSFVFHRSTALFERRRDKLVSTVVSAFTAAYVLAWDRVFRSDDGHDGDGREGGGDDDEGQGEKNEGREQEDAAPKLSLTMLPTFDGRAVCYPSWANLRDYLSWRQVDCHINNLYNTTFWALVQRGGMTHTAAEEFLKGTVASDKNEILWSRFGINYNNEPEMFRKGSVVFREYMLEGGWGKGKGGQQKQESEDAVGNREIEEQQGQDDHEDEDEDEDEAPAITRPVVSKTQVDKMRKARRKAKVVTKHVDIIRDDFWSQRPWLRSGKPGKPVDEEKTGL